jgi:hypothetical protein
LSLRGVISLSLMFHGGIELGCVRGYGRAPQNLMNQGYMTMMELDTCSVPEDTASPTPVGEYVVVCMVFYEWRFGVPSH